MAWRSRGGQIIDTAQLHNNQSSCPVFMLSFFFINCIIKYCSLFYWRPAVMASALPVAFRTLFTLFIYLFVYSSLCLVFVRKINSSSSSEVITGNHR